LKNLLIGDSKDNQANKDFNQAIKTMDINGDGEIGFDEFEKIMLAMFE